MVLWIFKVSSLWSYFLIIFSRILILFPHFKNMNTFIYVVGSSFWLSIVQIANFFVFYLKQMSQNPTKHLAGEQNCSGFTGERKLFPFSTVVLEAEAENAPCHFISQGREITLQKQTKT